MKYILLILLFIEFTYAKEIKDITVESSATVINISSEEAKNLALRRARSMIIENANGVEIISSALVKDGSLAGEFIKNYSRGIILNERVEWLPITQYQKNKNTPPIPEYNVKVTADVLIKEKETDLVINSNINKSVFFNHEKMILNLISSDNANIAIFFLGYDDKIYKLFPSDKNFLIKKNVPINIPRDNIDDFDLELIVPDKLKKITEALWIISAKESDNIHFNIHFNKEEYTLNKFFSIYSKFSEKCVEQIIPYTIEKTKEEI